MFVRHGSQTLGLRTESPGNSLGCASVFFVHTAKPIPSMLSIWHPFAGHSAFGDACYIVSFQVQVQLRWLSTDSNLRKYAQYGLSKFSKPDSPFRISSVDEEAKVAWLLPPARDVSLEPVADMLHMPAWRCKSWRGAGVSGFCDSHVRVTGRS